MEKYKLGDICEIVSGSTPKTGVSEYWDGDVKWITPAELNDETYIITDSVRKITQLGVRKTGLTPFPEGTVILSSRAPIGKVAIAGCEMYCNQGFKNLICSEKISNRYLYWFLKKNTGYLNSLGRGATFKEISKQIVSAIEINIPDIGAQNEIADNLEQVSRIIQLRKEELSKLDELVKARFVEMFGDVKKYCRLKEYSVLITKGASPKWQGIDYCDSGTLFVTSENVRDGYLDLSKKKYLDNKINDIQPRSILKQDDVLINIVGASIGRAAIYNYDELANINQAVALVRVDFSRINQKYLMTYLNSPQAREMYVKMKKGGARDNLSLQNISDLKIPNVPIVLQNQFAAFASQVDKSKVVVQKALDETQTLFDNLMQEYFG
jgi:type I restriction enzyme S subunit